MGMLKRGTKFTPTQPDVMAILEKLYCEEKEVQSVFGKRT